MASAPAMTRRGGGSSLGDRLLREELGAEESRVDDGGVDVERRDLGSGDSIQSSRPNFEAA
jgi:hypothetical protein